MFGNPSLMTRIAIGKGIGFLIGLAGFILLPYFLPEAGWLLRWGILFWYTTIGAIIGVFGVFTFHPILKLPFPWWLRAPIIGAWMNFVLVFFAYDVMGAMMVSLFGEGGMLSSPFWFTVEGAIVGSVIGYFLPLDLVVKVKRQSVSNYPVEIGSLWLTVGYEFPMVLTHIRIRSEGPLVAVSCPSNYSISYGVNDRFG